MDRMEKLKILGESAKFDVSCSSSGTQRAGERGKLGSASLGGICHSWAEDGRCISLLKVLLSNACIYNCAYCVNRRSNDLPRASFTPEELAELTIEFYRRNYIEGLFLSSAVVKNPDYTMELMIRTLVLLRKQYGFRGYIHAKVIPSASPDLIQQMGILADRISVNMEFTSKKSLALLAADKNHKTILAPMGLIKSAKEENQYALAHYRKAPVFAPAGQTTQVIVGATPERDQHILTVSSRLYREYQMKRVYYSAYIPLATHPNLPAPLGFQPPLLREHRLYQADWLLRFYRFSVEEIFSPQQPDLALDVDPKIQYALAHPELYPVDVNRASYDMLLRVPGIGVRSAQRIMEARRFGTLDEFGLKKLGVVMKRAQYFLCFHGKILGKMEPGNPLLREVLRDGTTVQQTRFF